MTDRERLIRLMQEASQSKSDYSGNIGLGQIADYLLANGVIVPPCKVGDTVYCIVFCPAINKLSVSKGFVREIRITKNDITINIVDCEQIKYANLNINITCNDFGKTVFLTREEAERALREREHND